MPTYKFEAMDTTGGEVKDSVEAGSEEEAQQKIRQMGYFVTRIQEAGGQKKGQKAKQKKKKRKGQVFTIGGVSSKQLCTFTRQFSTLQDAGLPVLRSLKILEQQMKPGALKNCLMDVVEDIEGTVETAERKGCGRRRRLGKRVLDGAGRRLGVELVGVDDVRDTQSS